MFTDVSNSTRKRNYTLYTIHHVLYIIYVGGNEQ